MRATSDRPLLGWAPSGARPSSNTYSGAGLKLRFDGRCYRCGVWLRYIPGKPHVCNPRREQFYQAWLRAWTTLTQSDRRVEAPGPPRKPRRADRPTWDLPRPDPRPRLDVAPRGVRAVTAAPIVLLMPTVLLRETTAQRGGEPVTVRTRRYPSTTISALRKRCQCPPGMCTAAAIATMLHSLPWSYTVSLDAPPGELLDRVAYFQSRGLKALDSLVSSPPRICDPFYILSVARRYRFGSEGLHAHLIVGNVTYAELQSLLSSWGGFISPNAISRADRPTEPTWSAVHYVLDQAPRVGDDLIDSYPSLRHLCDYGRGMGHFTLPILSPALEDSGPLMPEFRTPDNYTPGILTRFRRLLAKVGARRRRQKSRSPEKRRLERARAKQRRKP